MKIIDTINTFANDPDRGFGHGISHGLIYGVAILIFTSFLPWYCALILCAANHLRVCYQELWVEHWWDKPKTRDFWYDILSRAIQTDLIAFLPFIPKNWWWLVCLISLVVGYKTKTDRNIIRLYL